MADRPLLAVLAASAVAAAVLLLRKRRTTAAARTKDPTSDKLVVVVGLGGVGSHAAHLLVRGGVRRLRLVDFDQVSLSSLNRHATAVRWHVGTPKALALRASLLAIAPDAEIEACVELFNEATAAELLDNRPTLVVDCIDDLATKAALLGHCVREGLPVLCALGAGGKADACALHIGKLSEVFNDPIATSMLKRLRKQRLQQAGAAAAASALEVVEDGGGGSSSGARGGGKSAAVGGEGGEGCDWLTDMAHQVSVVYSSEQQRVALMPLPEGVAASELGNVSSFRVRVMPVLPPLPAAVGAALAAHAIATLSGVPVTPVARPVPSLSSAFLTKLQRKFVQHETKELKRPAAEATLSLHEVALIVCDVFRCRCALTGRRLHDPARPAFCLVRYDARRAADVSNVLFTVAEAAAAHERDGIDALPPPLRKEIDRAVAEGLAGRRVSLFEAALHAPGPG